MQHLALSLVKPHEISMGQPGLNLMRFPSLACPGHSGGYLILQVCKVPKILPIKAFKIFWLFLYSEFVTQEKHQEDILKRQKQQEKTLLAA